MKNNLRFLFALAAGACFADGLRAETISAMGRVLPASGVFDLPGPGGEIVEAVLVKEGDWVDAGTPLARLSSTNFNAERVRQLETELAAAKALLAGDGAVARQMLALAEEEAKIAKDRLARIQSARDSEFISPDTIELRAMANAAALFKVSQMRQDVMKAEREARRAIQAAEVELVQARLALAISQVQAPARARVLKVLAKPGQPSGRQELFKLADTTTMHVIAEVYESDILRVKPGQRATVSSVAFEKPVGGVVENVSRIVYRNTLQSIDPGAQVYARVLEVLIRMDAVEPLDRLVYLQVDVKIAL